MKICPYCDTINNDYEVICKSCSRVLENNPEKVERKKEKIKNRERKIKEREEDFKRKQEEAIQEMEERAKARELTRLLKSENKTKNKFMKGRIHVGKLFLSLLIYIAGFFIFSFIAAFIITSLLNIPLLRDLLYFFADTGIIDVGFASTIISLIACFSITSKINENTEETHLLATFIFGIMFLILHLISLVLNIISGNAFFINIIGILFGVGMIIWGRSFNK